LGNIDFCRQFTNIATIGKLYVARVKFELRLHKVCDCVTRSSKVKKKNNNNSNKRELDEICAKKRMGLMSSVRNWLLEIAIAITGIIFIQYLLKHKKVNLLLIYKKKPQLFKPFNPKKWAINIVGGLPLLHFRRNSSSKRLSFLNNLRVRGRNVVSVTVS